MREIPFGQDGSFSYDALVGRCNADLANGLGNLASRTLTMIRQYRDGKVPAQGAAPNVAEEAAKAILDAAASDDPVWDRSAGTRGRGEYDVMSWAPCGPARRGPARLALGDGLLARRRRRPGRAG